MTVFLWRKLPTTPGIVRAYVNGRLYYSIWKQKDGSLWITGMSTNTTKSFPTMALAKEAALSDAFRSWGIRSWGIG